MEVSYRSFPKNFLSNRLSIKIRDKLYTIGHTGLVLGHIHSYPVSGLIIHKDDVSGLVVTKSHWTKGQNRKSNNGAIGTYRASLIRCRTIH